MGGLQGISLDGWQHGALPPFSYKASPYLLSHGVYGFGT